MPRVGVDFGTGNTVIAVFNQNLGRAQTLEMPGITTAMRYRLAAGGPEQMVHVVPSLIHYSESETLIGDQVLSRGLAEHKDTFRWMKRSIALRNNRGRRTAQGLKNALDAGTDFLARVLRYASDRVSLENDEFTFTAPTEAFETFQDWLRRLAETAGIRRLRMMDEPTACVLGYHGTARQADRFAVFDHGCGTLDICVVKLDLAQAQERKATQLGQAGTDGVGGMDLDRWIHDDFCRRHGLVESERGDLQALILRQAEKAKIELSDPSTSEAEVQVVRRSNGSVRLLRTSYRRNCPACEAGRVGKHEDTAEGCLGCLLVANEFARKSRQTLDRALENAAMKASVRRDDITRVLVTGGTSLVPCVGAMLRECFDGRVEFASPFDAVARGACMGIVAPILQHDYAIESYNREKDAYEFKPLFKSGTEYPTPADLPRRLMIRGSVEGQTRLGIRIFEVSQVKRMQLSEGMVDEQGAIKEESRVATDVSYICLNRANPTFIVADPAVSLDRDKERFQCSFQVDGQRRLLVSVLDKQTGRPLLKEHPVVRL